MPAINREVICSYFNNSFVIFQQRVPRAAAQLYKQVGWIWFIMYCPSSPYFQYFVHTSDPLSCLFLMCSWLESQLWTSHLQSHHHETSKERNGDIQMATSTGNIHKNVYMQFIDYMLENQPFVSTFSKFIW